MRISDWSSDVCSSDLPSCGSGARIRRRYRAFQAPAHVRRTTPLPHDCTADARQGGYGICRGCPDAEAALSGNPLSYVDRKSVVSGKSVSVRVDLGGRRIIKKKK